jgi:hypothetical protein
VCQIAPTSQIRYRPMKKNHFKKQAFNNKNILIDKKK